DPARCRRSPVRSRRGTRPMTAGRSRAIAAATALLAFAATIVTPGCDQARRGRQAGFSAGRRLVAATVRDPTTFNPGLVPDPASGAALGPLFEGLVRINPKTTLVEPALAESWQWRDGGRICEFKLRRDVRWHDGAPFTAEDVAFTFDAIYDDRVPNSSKHVLTVGGEPIRTAVVDPHTIRLHLKEPFAPLLNSIGFGILPKHVLGPALADGTFTQSWGVDTPPEKIIGTGPYRLVRYVPAQLLQYARNLSYWMRTEDGDRLPRLAERTTLIVPDQNT